MKTFLYVYILFTSVVLADIKTVYLHSKVKEYAPITRDEYYEYISVFEELLKDTSKINHAALKKLNFKLVSLNDEMIALTDTSAKGRGLYLIKKTASVSTMLSIPHRFYDTKTGFIGRKLVQEAPYKAAAFNTVHRKSMDAAHTRMSAFNAFHVAYARVYPHSNIYQIHGFSNTKRREVLLQRAGVIVSSSSLRVNEKLTSLACCLKGIHQETRVYGRDVFELGGTKNAQYLSLAQEGYSGFVHIELNAQFRNDLSENKALRKSFSRCCK